MTSLRETKQNIVSDPEHWLIPLMDFVDDFRYYKDPVAIAEPLTFDNEKIDALLAATVHSLCNEVDLQIPNWVWQAPPCREPWFVSGMESLKAIALVESPLPFRLRKIFVLENFLTRV